MKRHNGEAMDGSTDRREFYFGDGGRRPTRKKDGIKDADRPNIQTEYVKAILSYQEEIAAQNDSILKGKIEETFHLVKELLLTLYLHGPQSVEGLSRELNVEHELVRRIVRSLARKKFVKTSLSERGKTIVRPVAQR